MPKPLGRRLGSFQGIGIAKRNQYGSHRRPERHIERIENRLSKMGVANIQIIVIQPPVSIRVMNAFSQNRPQRV